MDSFDNDYDDDNNNNNLIIINNNNKKKKEFVNKKLYFVMKTGNC